MKKQVRNTTFINRIVITIMMFFMICVVFTANVCADDTTDYLCFTALQDASIILEENGTPSSVTLKTKKNDGSWESYSINTPISLSSGDKLFFRNESTETTGFSISEDDYYHFDILNGNVSVSGDITTLINISGTNALTSDYCFANLFSENTEFLASISGISLPATTLTAGCYYQMFRDCSYISSVPIDLLPATKLAPHCYEYMFCRCDDISELPNLPATELAEDCYNGMFESANVMNLLSPIQDDDHSIICKIPSSGKITIDDESVSSIIPGVNPVDGVYTFYYKGKPPYSVTYYGNGNTGGDVPVDSNSYNSNDTTVVLGVGSLVKTNQAFKGWNRKADGSGALYMPSNTLTITSNISLYAIWGDYAFTADSGIGGASGDKIYVKKSLKDLLFTCDGPKDQCQKVSVDGIELAETTEYTIVSGSTKITLKGSYLETLSLGNHTIKLTYSNGQEPTAVFSVVEKNGSSNKNRNDKLFSVPNTGVY